MEIRQDPGYLRGQKGSTGSVVWGITPRFVRFMRARKYLGLEPETHLLELGSGGCGVFPVSMRGVCLVTCSDADHVLMKRLRGNLDRNGCDHMTILQIDWEDEDRAYLPLIKHVTHHVDCIVCLDCVYNPYLVPALVKTLTSLCRAHPGCLVMLAQQLRDHESHLVLMTELLTCFEVHRWTGGDGIDHDLGSGDVLYFCKLLLPSQSSPKAVP